MLNIMSYRNYFLWKYSLFLVNFTILEDKKIKSY